MKKVLKFSMLMSMAILLNVFVYAQSGAPDGINYQAVVRDGSNNVLANTVLTVKVGIYDGPSSAGVLLYEETHNVTSSAYGTINLIVGQGTVNSGDFTTIDWLNIDAYAKIDVDAGSGYVNLSETKLQSVPYALSANKAQVADSVVNKQWGENATSLFSVNKNVGINTATPASGFQLDVIASLGDSAGIHSYGYLSILGSSINGPTIGALGVQGKNNMFGISGLNFLGDEIGVFAVSNGGSSSDNYGIFAYSNGVAGGFQHATSGYTANLATSTYAADFNGPVRVQGNTSSPQPNTIYGNSLPLAYGEISGNNVNSGYGIASVTNSSTGVYVITLSNSWSGFPVVLATSYNLSNDTEILTYSFTGNNQITVRCVDENNNPVTTVFSILVFGTPL